MPKSNSEEVELLPCPFCGAPAILVSLKGDRVSCSFYGCLEYNLWRPIPHWQTRTPKPPKDKEPCKFCQSRECDGRCIMNKYSQPPKDSGLQPIDRNNFANWAMKNGLSLEQIDECITKFRHPPLPRRVDAAEIEKIIAHESNGVFPGILRHHIANKIASYLNGDKS